MDEPLTEIPSFPPHRLTRSQELPSTLPFLLAIETTTDTCSVAVFSEGHVQIERTMCRPKVHAEHLVPMIKEVLAYANVQVHNLDGIAVSSGPGSYTGLRIGVSTAKGLAFAHSLKLISIPSLSAMAFSCLPFVKEGDAIIISRNSRKEEVYVACFEKTSATRCTLLEGPSAILLSELESNIPDNVASRDKIWLAGEGSIPVQDRLPQNILERCEVLPASSVSPSATSIACLGAISFENGSFEDIASFEPVYLKDFIPKLRAKSVFERLPF